MCKILQWVYLCVQVSLKPRCILLLKRNRVSSLLSCCSPLAIRVGTGRIYSFHRYPAKNACLIQPSGSSPVPGLLALLWQFVKLEKEFASLVTVPWNVIVEVAAELCLSPSGCWRSLPRKRNAVNAASGRMYCNSSDLGGSVSSLQKWEQGVALFFKRASLMTQRTSRSLNPYLYMQPFKDRHAHSDSACSCLVIVLDLGHYILKIPYSNSKRSVSRSEIHKSNFT